MKDHIVFVTPDGRMDSIGDFPIEFQQGAKVSKKRVSLVIPVDPTKRVIFRLIRIIAGDDGKLAAWTRTWRGPWISVILATGETFKHHQRSACIQWERGRLEQLREQGEL